MECDESDSSNTIDSGHWISFKRFARPPIPNSPPPSFGVLRPMVQQMTLNDHNMDVGGMMGGGEERLHQNGRIKAWEGEKIHDVGMDDLELTLGSAKPRTSS